MAFIYDRIDYHDTTVYAGGNVGVEVMPGLKWISGIEIEKSIENKQPVYNAHDPYHFLKTYSKKAEFSDTRGAVYSGVEYALNKNLKVSVMPGVSRTALGDIAWGGSIHLTGHF